jgi:hypothetical protein
MLQISPQETFPIVYKLSDPNETDTYYVRAVVRNSVTGAIIKINGANFVNLTDRTSGRFSTSVQAPHDASGLGFYIDVTITVYSDSGYTTKNQKYADVLDCYLVQARVNSSSLGGGGLGFDYKKLKEIVIEALNSLPTTDVPETDLTPVTQRLGRILNLVEALEAREILTPESFAPHTDKIITTINKAIKNIPEVDVTPILEKLDSIEFPEPLPFPEIPQPNDYSAELKNITDIIQNLLKIIPEQKYSLFLDTLAEKMVKTQPEPALENNDRVQKLMAHD